MSKRHIHTLYILLIFSSLLSGCFEDDAKQVLKQSLQELVASVEQKKQRAVSNKLTSNFRGNLQFNQQTMSSLIFTYYRSHKFIKIYTLINAIEIKEIKTDSPQAKIVFHAALTSTKSTLPEHMRVFKIDSRWLKVDREWKMSAANWIEVLPQTVYPEIKKRIEYLKDNSPKEIGLEK